MRYALRRQAGPVVVWALVGGEALVWWAKRQDRAAGPGWSYAGQWLGAESILLVSIGVVLISMLPWVESWFDGIDRAAIWHRRVAIAGLLLLLPHLLLAGNPRANPLGAPLGIAGAAGMSVLALWAMLPRWRSITPAALRPVVAGLREHPWAGRLRDLLGGYDRWRMVHRTAGVFLAFGFLHGIYDGDAGPAWTYLVSGGVGLLFYLYREVLARRLRVLHDYRVAAVTPVGDGLTELTLSPVGTPMRFTPGQFAMVYLEARDGWHRHPFTITSAPSDPVLRFTVKALGDYTTRLDALVEPGMPAVIGGPHGRFTHRNGTARQIWIAGGVGVTPFLSWLRSLDEHPVTADVDFFYSTDQADPPYSDEIARAAAGHGNIHVHVVDTRSGGRLTGERILTTVQAPPSETSVFLCGPEPMVRDLQGGLRKAGVRRVHREFFDWR